MAAAATPLYDRLTIDLVARIVTNAGVSATEVEQRAAVVGADPEADYAAVAIGFNPAVEARATLPAQRDILGYVGMRVSGRVLVGSLEDHPLLLVPTPPGQLRALQTILRAALRGRGTADGGPVVGLAARTSRLVAAHDIAHQARMAVQIGTKLGRQGEVVGYGDVAVEALLLRSPDTTQLIVDQLAPIRDRPELLATLRVWLNSGQSAREAARRLYVHPNTVPHRLRKIGRMLERPLNGQDDMLDLRLAFRALDLGRTPTQPGAALGRGPVIDRTALPS